MPLGERIYIRMKNLSLTQVELAKKTGLTQQVVSQYIRNRSRPGYNAIISLMKGLEVKSEWFFEGAEKPVLTTIQLTQKERIAKLEMKINQLVLQTSNTVNEDN